MQVGKEDVFEKHYTQKFRVLASQFGEFVGYERDRAARDIGLHCTRQSKFGNELVTSTLVWFQLKGLRKSTLSEAEVEKKDRISISLQTNHLRFWYCQLTPTYLVVYLESIDKFCILNIKQYLDETVGDGILKERAVSKTISFPVSGHALNEQAFHNILQAGDIEFWKQKYSESNLAATTIVRDLHVIKAVGTSKGRGKEQRITYKPWISKLRTEVKFEEREPGKEWTDYHRHWHLAMGDIESAFPYLKFSSYNSDDCDDDADHQLILASGEEIPGSNCSNEFDIFYLSATLNELGILWLERIEDLEKAGILEVDLDEHQWVTVLPRTPYK